VNLVPRSSASYNTLLVTVRDRQSLVAVRNAGVTLKKTTGETINTLFTDDTGRVTFVVLPNTAYTASVLHSEFRTPMPQSILINAGSVNELTFRLDRAALACVWLFFFNFCF